MWGAPSYHSQTYYPSYDAYRRPPARRSQPQPSSSSPMTPGIIWIERGPDGRPYFVRKKGKVPSARELLSDTLAPLKKRSSPFSRAYHRDYHVFPAPVNAPLYLPAPPIPPASSTPNLPPNDGRPPSGANTAAMDSTSYNHHLRSQSQHGQHKQLDSNPPRGILKPQPPSYPVPDPLMYPAPPQNFQPNQQAGYGLMPQHPSFQQLANIPTQPPGAYPTEPLPPDARVISPPRYPTADDLKHKCSNCGRFRSARYHYKHPLQPGQLPRRTICGRCREEATDSEDSISSESSDERRRRRRRARSRSRSRSRARSVIQGPRRSSRRRSLSRGRAQWSDDDDEEIGEIRRSYSRSSSLEMEMELSQRPASSEVDIVRYVERPPRPQVTRRIVYVESERPRRDRDYDGYDEDDGREYRSSYRSRRYSRPATPAPRIVRRQSSDSYIRTPAAIEDRRVFDEDDDYQRPIRPPPRRESQVRLTSAPYSRSEARYISESDDTFYDDPRSTSYRRPRSLMGRGRGRSWDRTESPVYERQNSRRRGSMVPQAPDPPGWDGAAEQVEQVEWRRSAERRLDDEPERRRISRSRRTSRVRSRSRSRSDEHRRPASEFLQSGDELTVIEQHDSRPAEDYDWYDRNGMRVRVREI